MPRKWEPVPPFVRSYFFDTSAVVKLIVDEPGSRTVRRIVDLRGHGALCETSRMALAEAVVVLKRKWSENLKAAQDQEEIDAAYERYRRRLFNLYSVVPLDFKIHPDPLDQGAAALWAVISEIRPLAHGAIDAVDIMHAGIFATPLLMSASGESKPYMVSSDAALNAYCEAKNILVLDPIAEEPHL